MKKLLKLALFLMLPGWCAAQSTWYVRQLDGGTRLSANVPTGQCDGLSNLPAAGATANHCAFKEMRYLYQDGSFYNGTVSGSNWGWVMSSGDTAIVDCGPSAPCRFSGWPSLTTCVMGSQFFGNCGNQGGSPPAPPNGVHIWGVNHGSCTAQSARTKIIGGFGAGAVFTLAGVDSVDFACFDVSDQSQCGVGAASVVQCKTGGVVMEDYANQGITSENTTTNTTVTDVRIHGLANSCILGSTGDGVVFTDVQIVACGQTGFNADDGSGVNTGVGHLSLTNYEISWNGCNEEYPVSTITAWSISSNVVTFTAMNPSLLGKVVTLSGFGTSTFFNGQTMTVTAQTSTTFSGTFTHADGSGTEAGVSTYTPDALPYWNCADQSFGTNGDGFGTATLTSPSPGWQIAFDQGLVYNNTQDGLDNLHTSGNGSAVSITRTLAYGSEGQQIKVGSAAVFSVINNIIIGNCEALLQTIPGRPIPTQDFIGDDCRAGNTAMLGFVNDGLTSVYQDNTMFSEGSVGIEIEYGGSVLGTAALKYQNNVFVGFFNSGTGENPPPMYSNGGPSGSGGPSALPALQAAGGAFTNNATFDQESSWPCPNTSLGETAALCTSPQLTDMTYHAYGYGDVSPTSGAAVLGAGTNPAGISAYDFLANTRGNPQTIGACEDAGVACPGVSAPTVATPTFSPAAGTYGPMQTVTVSTATGGASIIYTADGSTPTVTALTCTITHGTLYSGALTVSTSQTLTAIGCLSGDNASTPGVAAYVINGAAATPTFSPVAGTYSSAQSVTLSTATSGCGSYLVWNTTNAQSGGNLTGTSATNPLTVATSETIYAQVQSCPGWSNSAIGSATYTITLPPTTFHMNGTVSVGGSIGKIQ